MHYTGYAVPKLQKEFSY